MLTAQKQKLSLDERMQAIEESIALYHVYLESYLWSLTRNKADAEDILSALWVSAFKSFKDEHLRALPVLRRKAFQLFVDHYRKQVRLNSREVALEEPPEYGVSHVGKEAYSQEEEQLLKAKFWAEFPAALTPAEREALWLSARYGFTLKEISEQTGTPLSTVGERLQAARAKFTDYMDHQ